MGLGLTLIEVTKQSDKEHGEVWQLRMACTASEAEA